MQKTEFLELPIYDTPDIDVFDLQDWNIANQNLDNTFKQIVSNGEQVEIVNTEIVGARKGLPSLKDKIDIIDLLLGTVELKLNNKSFKTFVSPGEFKLETDTDDTLSIQKCFDYAKLNKLKVMFETKEYIVSDTVFIYSKMNIDGNGATIKGDINKPLVSSKEVVDRTLVENLFLVGSDNAINILNHGISITCYYTTFRNIRISRCFYGIFLDITGATGNLVENKLLDITCSNNYGTGLYLGKVDNNKITDGVLRNCIVDNPLATTHPIEIGSSAGWVIDNIHIYGDSDIALLIRNSYHTQISNIYIEKFTRYGLGLLAVQTNVNVSNVTVKVSKNNNFIIYLSKSGSMPYGIPQLNVNNLFAFIPNELTGCVGITSNNASFYVKGNNVSFRTENVNFTEKNVPDLYYDVN